MKLLLARCARRAYFYLDVLNPWEFASVGWPVPGGFKDRALLTVR